MQEGSNEDRAGTGRWKLTVWLAEGPKKWETYEFDEEPEAKPGSKIVHYRGKRDGREQSVFLNIDKITNWSLVQNVRE